LMLAYLGYYQGALQRTALTLGESGRSMVWNTLFVDPKGRTARGQFTAALIPLAFVVWCYAGSGPNIYAPWDLLVLVYPAVVLHARRLHDMGRSGWFLLAPAVLTVVAMAIWARRISLGTQLDFAVPLAALLVFIGFALWGCIGKGQTEANGFGPPVAA
jgi:uncharacterized membrane protein YhaH (DUF805 family)